MIYKLIYEYPEPNYPEKFRIVTYPGIKSLKYMISNHGRVYNCDTKKFMKTYFDSDNHEKITLVTDTKHPKKRGNKQKHYFIHRLVVWEFIGPPPDEYHNIVSHKNEIPCCNFVHNLEWSSVLENTNHAKAYGKMNNIGINAKVCKYDEKTIRKICSYFEKGFNNIEIFELMTGRKDYKNGLNSIYQLINKLGKRICYRDIVVEYDYLPSRDFFKCNDETQKIRNMIKNNKTNFEILKEFGYTKPKQNRRFYNRIILERVKCEVLFNDYRKLDNHIHRNM